MLAGLAPFNRDSGSMRGTRKIYGGKKDAFLIKNTLNTRKSHSEDCH